MGASDRDSHGSARRLLGLGDDAPAAERRARYVRLRHHVEARAQASDDEDFVAAREAELALLDSVAGRSAAESSRVRVWLWAWAIGATAAAAVLLLTRAPAEAPKPAPDAGVLKPAGLLVQAEPDGAELEVFAAEDERVVVTAPADGRPHSLDAGAYRLQVRHPDCPDEWSQEVTLTPGDRAEFAPRVCRGRGEIVVRSNVEGDRVQIDGLDVGSTGELGHPVAVGAHQVQVTKLGYKPWNAQVKVTPDQALTLQAELEPEPKQSGAEQANAGPPPAPAPPPVAEAAGEDGGRVYRGPAEGPQLAPDTLGFGTGGSKSWHDAVKERLLAGYDSDRSGSLDTPEEVSAIPCEQWRTIEVSYETGGLRVDMARLYGFDGSKAPSNTLGIDYAMRGYAYDRMKQCGLKTDL